MTKFEKELLNTVNIINRNNDFTAVALKSEIYYGIHLTRTSQKDMLELSNCKYHDKDFTQTGIIHQCNLCYELDSTGSNITYIKNIKDLDLFEKTLIAINQLY